jgi:Holliday junction resolvase RusA-like endonuclease
MTRSDVWKKRPAVLKYRKFCDDLRARMPKKAIDKMQVNGVFCRFYLPFPKSSSKKDREKLNGKHHLSRPDTDNMIKAVLDALFAEDRMIHTIFAQKFWDTEGRIEFYQDLAELSTLTESKDSV